MQLGAPLVADAQLAQVMQPGEGALHDPALGTQARAVFDTALATTGFTPPDLSCRQDLALSVELVTIDRWVQ